MNEKWRPIKGFDGYEVSDRGRVRSYHKPIGYGGGTCVDFNSNPKILTQTPVGKLNHMRVTLYGDKRVSLLVHRLVAEAFIPNPNNYPIVRHMNNNPSDNRVSNLKWGTQSDNVGDSVKQGRMNYEGMITYNNGRKTPIKAINITTGECYVFNSQSDAAKKLKTSQGNVWRSLKNGGSIKGYIFEYIRDEGE